LETCEVHTPQSILYDVPPSGGSLEIGNRRLVMAGRSGRICSNVPPSGGSLEIGNKRDFAQHCISLSEVPPSGGSLEIGNLRSAHSAKYSLRCSPFGGIPRNWKHATTRSECCSSRVPPSGGSLEIGNSYGSSAQSGNSSRFPLRGDP